MTHHPLPDGDPGTPTPSAAALVGVLTVQRARLVGLAVRLLGQREAAEDAVQEASLRAVRGLAGFRGTSALSTWLHRIVVNVCLEELRRRRPVSALVEGVMAVTGSDPADAVVDRLDLVERLSALSPEHRQVATLVDICDMDYATAASTLGVPAGTVASRLARSREALRSAGPAAA